MIEDSEKVRSVVRKAIEHGLIRSGITEPLLSGMTERLYLAILAADHIEICASDPDRVEPLIGLPKRRRLENE